ncbi:MAG: D-alanyl-D-alanine carboxypeptidase family protein [Clostridiales bacterium]|nr:D-alanyl-D-alanine carboxypeptidase family protein [Clostridiales bacterium]
MNPGRRDVPIHRNTLQKAGANTTMSNNKRRDPIKLILVLTLVLAILTGAVYFAGNFITQFREELLADKQAEVQAANEQLKQEYALELAEFEKEQAAGANKAWPAQKTEGWDVVDLTHYPLENAGYVTVRRGDVINGGLLLVNEWHSRPADFAEDALVSIGENSKDVIGVRNYSQKLFPQAVEALVAALTDAKAVGLEHYVVDDAYRTYAEQEALFNKTMEKYASRYEGDALIARTKKEVNYPGTSEFNSGLSFTLYLYARGNDAVNDQLFSTSEQGKWLYENSWKYGLVFRFPKADFPLPGTEDKSYKTGVSLSLNCFRYVGKAHAAVMNHLNLCLEEYIEYLQEHPHIAVFENGVLKYEIVRQQVGDAESFSVQVTNKTRNYTMSLDNMGGVVTAFEY